MSRAKWPRTNLEKAQARLSEFLQKHGIVTKDENLDAETAALTALTAQLTEVRSKTFDSQSKQRSGDDTLPDVMQSSVVASLRGDIAKQEAKLQEAANNLGTNHPQYRRMEAEIAELKKQLKEEMARVTKGFSSSTSGRQGARSRTPCCHRSATEETARAQEPARPACGAAARRGRSAVCLQ
jgi:uncharacterized protein involved in exopolysaccharide biosynthesis